MRGKCTSASYVVWLVVQIIRIAVDADISVLELSEFEACVRGFREEALHRLDETKAASAPAAGSVRLGAELPPKKPKGFKKTLQNWFGGGSGGSAKRKASALAAGSTLASSYNYPASGIARGGSLPRGSFTPSSISRASDISSRFEARALALCIRNIRILSSPSLFN